MPLLSFTLFVFLGSFAAGLLGALTGLGGGVVLIPLLTLGFHVDLRYAIGASLISVIATSSGAAAAYVREGFSSVRIGMFLEVATTLGAVLGAFLAARTPTRALAILFGVVLLYSAWLSRSQVEDGSKTTVAINPWSDKLGMSGSYPDGPQAAWSRTRLTGFPRGSRWCLGRGRCRGCWGSGRAR